jgi:hypothetical protein
MVDIAKFLIIRFPPGAAGNMLASILQCSPEVAHWNQLQQNLKPNNDWTDYFQKVFTSEISQWLYHEPIGQLRWGTREIFSAKHPRGDNLSIDEFLHQEQVYCNEYYHEQKKAGRYLPIFWHKETMPIFFQNSRSLIIKLDQPSLRWFDHAVFFKHYKIVENNSEGVRVRLLENRPEIVPSTFLSQNQFEQRWPSFRSFVREKIWKNPHRKQYQHTKSNTNWPIPSLTINLSCLLDQKLFGQEYFKICNFLEITPSLCENKINELHTYWRNLHEF